MPVHVELFNKNPSAKSCALSCLHAFSAGAVAADALAVPSTPSTSITRPVDNISPNTYFYFKT